MEHPRHSLISKLVLVAATSLSFVALACAGIEPVPYTPQPSRIADPIAETKTLIEANVVPGCVASPQLRDTLLMVKFVCSNGVGNSVARLDRIESIVLQQSGEWYRVLVHHRGGGEDFTWSSKSLEDMQRLADALTALSKRGRAATPAMGIAM